MRNGELIEELSKYPKHFPVRVFVSSVLMPSKGPNGIDNWLIYSRNLDAREAVTVIHEGNHLLIESE